MTDILNTYLPIIIYILLCILIILLIIICFKVLRAINKAQEIVDEVDKKVKSLNGIFSIVDIFADKISSITEVITDSIVLFIKKISKKRKLKKEQEDRKEEDFDE